MGNPTRNTRRGGSGSSQRKTQRDKEDKPQKPIGQQTYKVNGQQMGGIDYLKNVINQNRTRNMPQYTNATPIANGEGVPYSRAVPTWNEILTVRPDARPPSSSTDPNAARNRAAYGSRMSLATDYPQMPAWTGSPSIRTGLMPYGPQRLGALQWRDVADQMSYEYEPPRDWDKTPISATRYGGFGSDTLQLPVSPGELVGVPTSRLLKGVPKPGTKLRNPRSGERERTDYTTDIELQESPQIPEYAGSGGYPEDWPVGGGGGGGGWGGQQNYPDWFERMYSWRF